MRRTDLVELLADVGLGGSMHSIVSQGKVESVLASKPEERRELVEEAAGLGKFKRRKHRAELKLARVGIQVERARDVEAEVRKRLRPLALQATAAERAEKLAAEVARLRARVAELDLVAADARRAEAEERRTAAGIARSGAQAKLQALLRDRQAAEEELEDAAGRREASVKALYRLQGATERIALRQEGAGALLARLRGDLGAAEAAAAAPADERLQELERAALEATATARAAAAASGASAERARAAQERLAALERGSAARADAELETLRGPEAGAGGAARPGRRRPRRRRPRVPPRRGPGARRAAWRFRRRSEHGSAGGAGRSGGRREAARAVPAELEHAANTATAAARAAQHEHEELVSRLALAEERLASLERALAEREGIPPAARALAEEGTPLALSLVDVEAGAERAVAAALGWRASAVVADDPPAALALLRRARDAGLGSLAVLVGSPAERVAELPVVPLAGLLSSTSPAVTVEGFGFDPERGELWFAGETAEAVLLELDARRRALEGEVAELRVDAKTAATGAQAATELARDAEAAYARVAHLRAVRTLDARLLGRLASSAARLDETLHAAATLAARLEGPLRERAETSAEQAAELGGELARVGAREHEVQQAANGANDRAAAAELARVRLGGEVQLRALDVPEAEREQVEREARELTEEADRAAVAAAEAADAAARISASAAELGARRPALDVDLLGRILAASERLDEALAVGARAAARFEAPLRGRVDAGASRAAELGGTLRELGAAEVALRQSAEEAAQRATGIEIELTRIDAESADARRRRDEADAEPAEGDDRDELAAKLERLDARRDPARTGEPAREGGVRGREGAPHRARDPAARPRAEPPGARGAPRGARPDRGAPVRGDVRGRRLALRGRCRHALPRGRGRLRLVEPEDGETESGIEVELRPAGKKITRLGMLSGGEKALGAISFLFALFLAKPCPFYLLDEVEAALDDTNIGRFVELLRRYADRAQFVVITHQKRTMEAADVLYGVTMSGDGVSEVVSRRLPREDAVAAAAS